LPFEEVGTAGLKSLFGQKQDLHPLGLLRDLSPLAHQDLLGFLLHLHVEYQLMKVEEGAGVGLEKSVLRRGGGGRFGAPPL
jgi:hypothetical protein